MAKDKQEIIKTVKITAKVINDAANDANARIDGNTVGDAILAQVKQVHPDR